MAIKMRRGADADFRPEKMQPGELAVTVDGTRKVYAAFAAGDVKELSSKEDVDKTIASGLQSLETSTNNKLQSLEKKASSAVDKISSENQRVQEELSRYEYYTKTESDLKYTVAPRKEASSANGELKLTDADDGLSYLALQGNSEQYTATASANLFDMGYQKSLGLDGANSFLNVNGEVTTAGGSSWSYSYYIKVKQNTLYSIRGILASTVAAFVFYNKDKTYISGISTNSAVIDGIRAFTTPANCEWLRISYNSSFTPEIYEGALQTSVTGAVETPSPDYPSEVRSVGDIPKDVNGVEIRNLLDEQSFINATFTEVPNIWYSIDKIEFPPGTYLINGWIQGDRIGAGSSSTIMLTIDKNVSTGKYIPVISGDGAAIKNGTMTIPEGSKGYIVVARAVSEKLNDIYSNYRLMITEAAEIDEYRPYIGENNGLVKLESTGINKVNVGQEPVYKSGQSSLNVNRWTPQEIILEQKGKTTSYAYADVNLIVGKTYSFYCRAQVVTIEGSPTTGATTIGFKKYPPSGMMYGQTGVARDGTYHDCYSKVELPEDVSLMLYVNSTSSSGGNVRLIVKDLMVVEGDRTLQEMKALKYQPYYNKITWIPLREPLRGITGNNLKLYADKVDKNGYVTQNIYFAEGKAMFTFDTDALGINASDSPYKYAYWPMQSIAQRAYSGTISVLCNMLKRGTYNVNQMAITNASVIVFNLPNTLTGLADAETDKAAITAAIKAWVNTNNPMVYYALKNPIEYQIPMVYIETYDQETNVRCLNKVKPSDMTLDYKIAMSSLIKRLEALEEKTVQEV